MEHQGSDYGAFASGAGVFCDVVRGSAHVVQKIEGFCFRLDFSAADRTGQQRPYRQFPGAAVVVRHPFADFEKRLRQGGVILADCNHLLEIAVPGIRTDRDDIGAPFSVAAPERDDDAHARRDPAAQSFRNPVIETPVERQIQEHPRNVRQFFHKSAEKVSSFI